MAEPERNNEARQGTGNSSNSILHYDEIIQKIIHPIFVRKINPDHVLHVIWKHNIHVLNQRDKDLIKKQTENKGPVPGAETLLECLSLYKNWFPCLIQVLRDKDVKQDHVAEMMLNAIDELQSDGQVDTTVKALAERDVLNEKLKAELENEKSEAEKVKQNYEMEIKKLKAELQNHVSEAEKVKQNYEMEINKLKAELQNCQNMLQKEMDKFTAKEQEMLELKVHAEKSKEDQCVVIHELMMESEQNGKIMAETMKAQVEKFKQEQNLELQKLKTNVGALINALLRKATTTCVMELLLHCFAEIGLYYEMEILIEKGADINKPDSDGKTVLMVAAEAGCIQNVNLLICYGADINIRDKNGFLALSYAITCGHADCVQALIEAGGRQQSDIPNLNGKTLLMVAASSEGDHVQCLENLLIAGANINLKDKLGYTVLAHAADSGNAKCVQALLKASKNEHVNIPNSSGQTPLMLSAKSKGDNVHCLKNLLHANADITAQDVLGYTALAYAAQYGNVNCLQTLLEVSSKVLINTPNTDRQTPLMLAAGSKGDNVQCVEKLLSYGADPAMRDFENATALHYANKYNNSQCKQSLQKVLPGSPTTSK